MVGMDLSAQAADESLVLTLAFQAYKVHLLVIMIGIFTERVVQCWPKHVEREEVSAHMRLESNEIIKY